jgi:hypothetical protein
MRLVAEAAGERFADPYPHGLDKVCESGESAPLFRQWIHEFTRHLPAGLDSDAHHQDELTLR